MLVCACVCVCERDRERERERKIVKDRERGKLIEIAVLEVSSESSIRLVLLCSYTTILFSRHFKCSTYVGIGFSSSSRTMKTAMRGLYR